MQHTEDLEMGALAEAIAAYAQPLLDQTDGSHQQVEKAFAITTLCYNLALSPEDSREKLLSEMRRSLEMDDDEFDAFRSSVVDPMIRRHEDMFPLMHQRLAARHRQQVPSLWADSSTAAPAEPHRPTDRYAPCPCNSGEKYKFCCGKKGR
jgi:uncharacterized protein YecA (UPF0149 family)